MNLIFKDKEFYRGLVKRATVKGLLRKLSEAEVRQRSNEDAPAPPPEKAPEDPNWVNVIQAGVILNVTPSCVHKYRRKGYIKKSRKVERTVLYYKKELQQLKQQLSENPKMFDRRGEKKHG